MNNPILGNADGSGAPNMQVPALTRFKNTNEHGQVVASFPPMSTTLGEPKYYTCSILTGSMHRQDGKRLGFVHGFLETKVLEDQRYLDHEIEDGNIYIAHATQDRVDAWMMQKDARGFIANSIRPQIEAEVKASLEASIRAETIAKLRAQGVVIPDTAEAEMDENQLAMELGMDDQKIPTAGAPATESNDATKLAGIDAARARIAALRSGSAKVTLTGNAPAMPTTGRLEGIVGSDKIAGAAAG